MVGFLNAFRRFQNSSTKWAKTAFGASALDGVTNRSHRFLEEALELSQAAGCTKEEALSLVEYVYGRPAGEPAQEVGGVMVTMAVLCSAMGVKLDEASAKELDRVWDKIVHIRAKEENKRKDSALPGVYEDG